MKGACSLYWFSSQYSWVALALTDSCTAQLLNMCPVWSSREPKANKWLVKLVKHLTRKRDLDHFLRRWQIKQGAGCVSNLGCSLTTQQENSISWNSLSKLVLRLCETLLTTSIKIFQLQIFRAAHEHTRAFQINQHLLSWISYFIILPTYLSLKSLWFPFPYYTQTKQEHTQSMPNQCSIW